MANSLDGGGGLDVVMNLNLVIIKILKFLNRLLIEHRSELVGANNVLRKSITCLEVIPWKTKKLS